MAHLATATKGNSRNKIGSQMAELPPALIILFILVFFPLMDMIYIYLAYCAGWYLNQIEAREIARRPPQALSGTFQVTVPQSINWNGFMGVREDETVSPSVKYIPSTKNPAVVGESQVTTTVSINPILSQTSSWLPNIPGLNEPLIFTYTNNTYQDDQQPQQQPP